MVAHFENRKRAEVMMQSRLTKARRGEAVSNLPIGWIQNPDSSYDFDPEAEATIRLVIETFWQTRSAHATVRALAKAGIQIPYRDRQRICFRKPSVCRVLRILKNLNYSGTYFYGKTQSHPGGPTLPNGQSQRIKVPEEKWIKIFDHHPAYMTKEQQEEIKSILNKNQYLNRDRPGKGPAPMQGLLRCGRCGANLSVTYPTKHSHYHCSRGHGYGEKPCTTFMSDEFDRFILRQVFKTLKTPPVEMLKSALEASRKKSLHELSWIESERERLGHEQRKAEDRADITRGSLPRVHFDALAKLEKVREEQERFEQKISLEPPSPTDESEQELDELCSIASDIPELWNHPAVTNQDKKEILRCVIDHVLVSTDKKKIDAKIVWQSGTETSFSIWQRGNWGSLIGELHAQKLTASEIQEHLAAGKTFYGPSSKYHPGLHLYDIEEPAS